MSIGAKKLQVLSILADNLKNADPQCVCCDDIASQLRMSVKETEQLIKVMNHMGIIESSVEGHLCLITRKGVQYLNRQAAL